MAATICGAPNIAAIPAATPTIKPQETLPVKKPIPTEMIAKAAKALPALPVTSCIALHIVVTKALSFTSPLTALAAALASDRTGTIAGATAKRQNEKRAILAKNEESFFMFFLNFFEEENKEKPWTGKDRVVNCTIAFKIATKNFALL
jgi:hypothetical protein